MAITILGEGFLEVDLPTDRKNPNAYRWDDIVALFHKANIGGGDIEFPANLAGQRGTLVAVVTRQPWKLNQHDHAIRQGAVTPKRGSMVVLGTGEVRLRERSINDYVSDLYTNNAIGILPRLDGDAVRSLMSQWVRLELHQ